MDVPTVTVEIGFGVDPSVDYLFLDDADRGLLDTGRLAPEGGVWTDVSDYLRAVEWDAGKTNGLDRFREGRAQVVLDNRDARFDPENLSGPYVTGGVTQVVPMRRIRISTTYSGTTVTQFAGFVDDWILEYRNPTDAFVVVPATDGTNVLRNFDPPAASSPTGEGELSGARIERIATAAGWATGDRDIDTGTTTQQATTLAQNAWTEILLTADTEAGDAFISKDGKLTLRDRHWLFEDTRSLEVQTTWGDSAANIAAGTELPYVELVRANDADLVRNDVSIARAGGEAQTSEDTASQTKYLVRPFTRTDLLFEDDDESQVYADGIVFVYGDHRTRVDSMRVAPGRKPATIYPVVLGARFGDLWKVIRRVPGSVTVTKYVHVVGWTHRFEATSKDWQSTFRFADATPYRGHLILDHASLGLLDTGTLAPF